MKKSIIQTCKIKPVVLSEEEFAYYEKALAFALKNGFKIKLFDAYGKLKGFQG